MKLDRNFLIHIAKSVQSSLQFNQYVCVCIDDYVVHNDYCCSNIISKQASNNKKLKDSRRSAEAWIESAIK